MKLHFFSITFPEGKNKPSNQNILCTLDACAESDRTMDIPFKKLTQTQAYLSLFNFLNWNDIYRGQPDEAFRASCSYISSLGGGDTEKSFEYLMTNPTVRILITDEKVFTTLQDKLQTKK